MSTAGVKNDNLDESIDLFIKGNTYKDCSTIIVTPTRAGTGPALTIRWTQAALGLIRPANQKIVGPLFVAGHEVATAYNQAILMIHNMPSLMHFKYILTYEDDILPPPDGLLKLIQTIEGGTDGNEYDCVQGLYWAKGDFGFPMIYGDPDEFPMNFRPQPPRKDTVQRCNGLGMGFNLFRASMFHDPRLGYGNWFKTEQRWNMIEGGSGYTQDLFFFEKASTWGYRAACDTRVLCGHYDHEEDKVW